MNKLIIAAGTAKYEHLPHFLQRPEITGIVDSVSAFFTERLGYTRVLTEISHDPTSRDLVDKTDEWFGSLDREQTDWVVFYYTGHGSVEGDSFLVWTSDSRDGRAASTTVSAESLGRILTGKAAEQRNRRVRNCLLILDTCHSGAGAFQVVNKLSGSFDEDEPGRFLVLAAALPREEAMAGALARALTEAIDDEALGGSYQPVLYLEQLEAAINKRLAPNRVLSSAIGSSTEEPQFFPNPRYLPGVASGATVSDLRRAAQKPGMQSQLRQGSHASDLPQSLDFIGRKRILKELGTWLGDASDSSTRVITGGPGAGKSAIIRKFVELSDEVYRQRLGAFDCAIPANGRTLEQIQESIAKRCGIDGSDVVKGLEASARSFRLALDALDEASDAGRIVRELLQPLSSMPNVKLLLGTRPEYVEQLRENAVVLRVDNAGYLPMEELAEYATDKLLNAGDGRSPYEAQPDLARRVGQAVAKKAFPNFLVTKLVVENLRSTAQVVNEADLAVQRFPETVFEAFGNYLQRFGENEERVRDLLTPLAWAEGGGLPWDQVWAPLSSAIFRRSYQQSDITWLFENAGSFVVETLEAGRSVYRLYHEALAEFLRRNQDPVTIQASFVRVLLEGVPLAEGVPDWQKAQPYVKSHLAEHASAAGVLAELLADSGFLLAANPTRLLRAISLSQQPLPSKLVDTYKAASIHIRTKPLQVAASYLILAARQRGAQLSINSLISPEWTVPWADWNPGLSHLRIGFGASEITALDIGFWEDGEAVAIVGRDDGAVEVWDIGTNKRLAAWSSHDGSVYKIAVTASSCVVAASSEGVLTTYSSRATPVRRQISSDPDGRITALTVAEVEGSWRAITAQRNLRLAIWSLPDVELVAEHREAAPAPVYALAVITQASQPLLLTAGDCLCKVVMEKDESTLRLWSLPGLELLWEDHRVQEGSGYVDYIRSARFEGRELTFVSGVAIEQIWDIADKKILRRFDSTARLSPYQYGEGCLVIEETFGVFKVCRPAWQDDHRIYYQPQPPPKRFLALHCDGVIEGLGNKLTQAFRFEGQEAVLTSGGNHVRVWNLSEIAAVSGPATQSGTLHQQCIVRLDDRYVGFASRPGEVAYTRLSGAPEIFRVGFPHGANGPLSARAMVHDAACSETLVATDLGKIFRTSPSQPSATEIIDTRQQLECFQTAEWNGLRIGVTTGGVRNEGKTTYSARVWDLDRGIELLTDRSFALTHGQEDKPLRSLAVSETEGNVRFAFAGQYGKIMVAAFVEDTRFRYPKDFVEWQLPFGGGYTQCMASEWDGGTALLAAGTESGDLALLDFSDGSVLAESPGAHKGPIYVLSFRKRAQRTLLLSAGADGYLRIWDRELKRVKEIELGESISAAIWMDEDSILVTTALGMVLFGLN